MLHENVKYDAIRMHVWELKMSAVGKRSIFYSLVWKGCAMGVEMWKRVNCGSIYDRRRYDSNSKIHNSRGMHVSSSHHIIAMRYCISHLKMRLFLLIWNN